VRLRPYQEESVRSVLNEWENGRNKTLLVLPTGAGKTVCFSKIAEQCVNHGERVMVLAHRWELLKQAQEKIEAVTGIKSAVEKAETSALGSDSPITVASMQTLVSDKRLNQYESDYFGAIIIDEAHHVMSDGYQKIMSHFPNAKVCGVTATADRGDKKDLGKYFDSLAYEYTLPQAIRDGYLCPIKALTIPLNIDISEVKVSQGDYQLGDLGHALDPYLEQIADEMAVTCKDRKTVVFLPLIETSKKFKDLLLERGMTAGEVNGMSDDREQILKDFDEGKYQVLCNSMLLTEGWDCPSVDCIVVLRPTKVRSLYCLDAETEVLTHSGWKTDVEVGEEVAAFDKETGEIRFVPALAKVRRPLDTDEYFCSLEGQSSSIRVTNKHRMLYDNKRHKRWKVKTAEEIANMKDGCTLPVSGYGKFKGVPLSDDELRFIGWVMTDGCINKSNNAITITQEKHQPWLEKIQECIDGCGLKYNRFERYVDSGYKRTSPTVVWTISKGKPRSRDKDKRGWGYLEPYLSKDLSPLLFDMTEHQFDVMLEAINLGDGHKQHARGWTQHSFHIKKGNKTFIERLQIMAIQRGYRASVCVDNKTNKSPLYGIHLKKQTFIKVGCTYGVHSVWRKETYKPEECWCVENELGTLVTRHHGKVTIVGNCQMLGRGTRLYPGKKDLLILDFLWMTQKHDLCRPASLMSSKADVVQRATKKLEEGKETLLDDMFIDLCERDVLAEREAALAEELRKQRRKKRALVDPLQYAFSIMDTDLTDYEPEFGWQSKPATDKQLTALEKFGIDSSVVQNVGQASLLMDKLISRSRAGLATPKQIRKLESYGFRHVGEWTKEQASAMMSRIAMNRWIVPRGIDPQRYVPNGN